MQEEGHGEPEGGLRDPAKGLEGRANLRQMVVILADAEEEREYCQRGYQGNSTETADDRVARAPSGLEVARVRQRTVILQRYGRGFGLGFAIFVPTFPKCLVLFTDILSQRHNSYTSNVLSRSFIFPSERHLLPIDQLSPNCDLNR